MTINTTTTRVIDVKDMIEFTGPSTVNYVVDIGKHIPKMYTYTIKNITTNGILQVSAITSPYIKLSALEFVLQPQQSKTITATFNDINLSTALAHNTTRLVEQIQWTILPIGTT